jgi:hypothetical protein
MVEDEADSKVRKLVIWKVLDGLSWADWQGEEGVDMGEVSVWIGKEERRSRGSKGTRSKRKLCIARFMWKRVAFEYSVCWLG